jgi:transaldolase
VQAETPTRFWINNPSLEEARLAIAAGAIGCTTNPTYVSKMHAKPREAAAVEAAIDSLIGREADDTVVAEKAQRRMAARLVELFLPLYEASGGGQGFVTIQGDPLAETRADSIIRDARENRGLGPNVIAKIPATVAGLEAIEVLIPEYVPIMATEVMGVSQAVSAWETYRKVTAACGKQPTFFVTHITGILDDYFAAVVKRDGICLDPAILKQAGIAVAKRQYRLHRERKYPGRMLGGGARKLADFTDFVGSDMHITINWAGTADALLRLDGPAESRIGDEIPPSAIAELKEKLPDFRRAYEVEGMTPGEFYDYGGVALFRSSFIKGWTYLLNLVKERRRIAGGK